MYSAGEIATFKLASFRMSHVSKKWGSFWLFIFEDDAGRQYKTFHRVGRRPLVPCDGCYVTGTVKKVSEYKGREQVELKDCKVLEPEKKEAGQL